MRKDDKEKQKIRLKKEIEKLPTFTYSFFRAKSHTTTENTRIAYAMDLRNFFTFLTESIFYLDDRKQITIDTLKEIKSEDIEKYLEHTGMYQAIKNDKWTTIQNNEKAKARKLAAVRSLFKYLYKKSLIESNPAELVDQPKIRQKNIITLERSEITKLLKVIEEGKELSDAQKIKHKYTKNRDLAIIALLLGTGIRVSECVGINLSDIHFENHGLKIFRKGGDESFVYFGDDVKEFLLTYYQERQKIIPMSGHEHAFFLSLQKSRISVRAVQNLVKKYAGFVNRLKNISPHKLRSTYGTQLYEESNDIYLVAEALGHSDVNTTKKHYAKLSETRRKEASRYIKLTEGE